MACEYTYKGMRFKTIDDLRSFVAQNLNITTSNFNYEGGLKTEQVLPDNRVETQPFGVDIVKSTKAYTHTPTLMFDFEGEVSDNYSYVEIKNMFLTDVATETFNVHKDFLDNLSEEAWLEDIDSVKKILRDVEQELIESNIDVIGLSDIAEDIITVREILNGVKNLKDNPSKESAKQLSDVLQNVFPKTIKHYVLDLPDVYKGKTIVNVEANYSDSNLFLEEGLIKVQDSLYHKVEREPIENVYQALYRGFLKNEISIPSAFIKVEDVQNPDNINVVIENIREYILSRDVGYEIDSALKEEVSALQVLHNHIPMTERVLSDDISTDINYLRRDFVRDFYKEVLKQKFENTPLYNKTLRYFKFTDGGLSFHGLTFEINELPLSEEFSDYVKIKKNVGKLGQGMETSVYRNEDLYYLNNPRKIQRGFGVEYIKDGLYASDLGNALYIRTPNNIIARKVVDSFEHSLYKEIQIPSDNVFNVTDLNFHTDIVNDMKSYESWSRNRVEGQKMIDVSGLENNIKKTTNLRSEDLQSALNNGIVIEDLNKETKNKYDECQL